ncbi:MAG: hypothetical protein LBU60_01660 [Clostridiales bacterium]|jgi:hypothetical protein|nr:hypothetical protein [Clostridiales bacterium]
MNESTQKTATDILFDKLVAIANEIPNKEHLGKFGCIQKIEVLINSLNHLHKGGHFFPNEII